MLKRMSFPLWAQYCIKSGDVQFEENENGSIVITGCNSIHECYGCDPTGVGLPVNPMKLELVEEFHSMNFKPEELNGVWIKEEAIAKRLRKYKEAEEKYFWWRGISMDLDAVRVWREKECE